MKKKKFYIVLSKEKRHNYGVFERNKLGLDQAKIYKEKLTKELQILFVIK